MGALAGSFGMPTVKARGYVGHGARPNPTIDTRVTALKKILNCFTRGLAARKTDDEFRKATDALAESNSEADGRSSDLYKA